MSQTGTAILIAATRTLTEAGIPDAPTDARKLLAYALGIAADRLTLHLTEPVAAEKEAAFAALVERRLAREPVSHLIGQRAFYGRQFRVTPDVLDPRPDTETLIEAALAQPFERVLDLGTGSGCILLTLLAEMPDATGLGLDREAGALAVAQDNANTLGLADRSAFLVSDWFQEVTETFDLIVSNPPYIAKAEMPDLSPEVQGYEPRVALTDEGDGLGCYRHILAQAAPFLRREGRILFEIGPSQAEDVSAIAAVRGFETTATIKDLDGRDRVVVLHQR